MLIALVAGALLAGNALLCTVAIGELGEGLSTVVVNAHVLIFPSAAQKQPDHRNALVLEEPPPPIPRGLPGPQLQDCPLIHDPAVPAAIVYPRHDRPPSSVQEQALTRVSIIAPQS
jgi:hypothetical protein